MINLKAKNPLSIDTPNSGYGIIFIDDTDGNLKLMKSDGSIIFINQNNQTIFDSTKTSNATHNIYQLNGTPDIGKEFYISINDQNDKKQILININGNYYDLVKPDKSAFNVNELSDIILPIAIKDNSAIIIGMDGIKVDSMDLNGFKSLINSSGLIANKIYIVSFKSKYTINGSVITSSINQSLLIKATSNNTFINRFNSLTYPNDLISLDITSEHITDRICTIKNLSANYDWRYVKFEKGLDNTLGLNTYSDISSPEFISNKSQIYTFDNSPSGGTCKNIRILVPNSNHPSYDDHGISNGRNSFHNCNNLIIENSTNISLTNCTSNNNSSIIIKNCDNVRFNNVRRMSLLNCDHMMSYDNTSLLNNISIKNSFNISILSSNNIEIKQSNDISIKNSFNISILSSSDVEIRQSNESNLINNSMVRLDDSDHIISHNNSNHNILKTFISTSYNVSNVSLYECNNSTVNNITGKNLYRESNEISRNVSSNSQNILCSSNDISDGVMKINFSLPLEDKPLYISFDTNNDNTADTPPISVKLNNNNISTISQIYIMIHSGMIDMLSESDGIIFNEPKLSSETLSQSIEHQSNPILEIQNGSIDITNIRNIFLLFNGNITIESLSYNNIKNLSKIRLIHKGSGNVDIINNSSAPIKIFTNDGNNISLTSVGHFVDMINIDNNWYVENYFN